MANARPKGMMFLDEHNPCIHSILMKKFVEEPKAEGGKPEGVDMKTPDFDGCMWRLNTKEGDASVVQVSIMMPGVSDLIEHGGKEAIMDGLPGKECDAGDGFDFAVECDSKDLGMDGGEAAMKMARLKRRIMGAPFQKYFEAMKAGKLKGLKKINISFRKGEQFWLVPTDDIVQVIFKVNFEDVTDRTVADVFLTEFQEAPAKIRGAPSTKFQVKVPDEITDSAKEDENDVGYLSFQITAKLVKTDEKMEKVINMLCQFRAYLHYHIKTTKGYLHMRMRERVQKLMKILNRAKCSAAAPKKRSKGKATKKKKSVRRDL